MSECSESDEMIREVNRPLTENVQYDEGPEEEEKLRFVGYKPSSCKLFFGYLISLCLLGFPLLILLWKPKWKVKVFNSRCSLPDAKFVLIYDEEGSSYVEAVSHMPVTDAFPQRYERTRRVEHASDDDHDQVTLISDQGSLLAFHIFFFLKHEKFVWDEEVFSFVRLTPFERELTLNSLLEDFEGHSAEKQHILQMLHGTNSIEVEVKSYGKLLLEEALNPFYVFQILSMILWSLDSYVFYASCILIISLVSIIATLLETRRQSQALHDMVASSNDLEVTVMRNEDNFQDVPTVALVPGDVIAIPSNGCIMSCDAVLISGTCIVNESMLTGESVPVTKTSVHHMDEHSDEVYDPEIHRRNTLFSGTSVIQTRYYGKSHVLAVVVRTGFSTAKGELVSSILYPKPVGFRFYKDAISFIVFLFGIATVGMTYSIYIYTKRGTDVVRIILRCLDIFTIVVPPALPAAMTVGTYYAQSRLRKSNIFCISPQRINMCGKLKLVCFDKTGTLTEDGLDFWGIQEVREGTFDNMAHDVDDKALDSPTMKCLATCHSLTLINNELIGDPLDIKMFEATGFTLEETGEDTNKFDLLMANVVKPPKNRLPVRLESNEEEPDDFSFQVGIVRQFTFSSSVARMSVIVKSIEGKQFEVFTKGAPEKLKLLCRPESLPLNFECQLRELTMKGFRVIGLAHKYLPIDMKWLKVQKMKRHEVEKDLTFLGFLIMQNKMKQETKPIIQELQNASIRCVMVTGDNMLTAVSVGMDCHMIHENHRLFHVEADERHIRFTENNKASRTGSDAYHTVNSIAEIEHGRMERDYHFAMNGTTWSIIRSHYKSILPKLLLKGTIFARMSPDQKTQLVEDLQSIDYVVSMCGDGANDCGALKAAHVGISLSEAEASVAAPFTSRVANISCVPIVIKEGRCALVTSFGVFKYMALYSMIQFISVLILYTFKTLFGDTQFLYIDLVITATVAVLMGWTKPFPRLVKRPPPASLISSTNLFSIGMHMLVTLTVQVGSIAYLTTLPWYKPLAPKNPEEEIFVCWETTTIFILSSFQYLIMAATFSTGPPYRQRIYTNIPFFTAIIFLTFCNTLLVLYPGPFLAHFFQLELDEDYPLGKWRYRLTLLVIALVNLVVALTIEKISSQSRLLKRFLHFLTNKKEPKNKYKKLLKELSFENWPPTTVHNSVEDSIT